jgi:hypothetical protein
MQDLENDVIRNRLLVEAPEHNHSKAILYHVEKKIEVAERKLKNNLHTMSADEKGYWVTRLYSLREIFDLPETGRKYLQDLEKRTKKT